MATVDVLMGSLDVDSAEARAMLRGIQVAIEEGITGFLIESDSITAVNGVNSDNFDSSPFGHILSAIKLLVGISACQEGW